MVTMVYGGEPWNPPIDFVREQMIRDGQLFTGPRSFTWWVNAVAYALLPEDPNMATTVRRRVARGSSGRWVVTQTSAPARGAECDVFPALPCPRRRERCQSFCIRQRRA